MGVYFVKSFHDSGLKQYASCRFVFADNRDDAKVKIRHIPYYIMIEDKKLAKPALFYSTVVHTYNDNNRFNHTDIVKKIFVKASSYFEAHEKLWQKFGDSPYHGNEAYRLEGLGKDTRKLIDIILSM